MTNPTTPDALLPCAHCGQKHDLALWQPCTDGGFGITCNKCHLTHDARAETPAEAIDAWNRRAGQSHADAGLLAALEMAEHAIAEYYRYFTGGETRGSYDGKPERRQLWEARYKARAAIAAAKGCRDAG